jgi:hypothetical protein
MSNFPTFGYTRVWNLGSVYDDWRWDVRLLLEELASNPHWQEAAPSISMGNLSRRARGLRYVCLVPDLTITASFKLPVAFQKQDGLAAELGPMLQQAEELQDNSSATQDPDMHRRAAEVNEVPHYALAPGGNYCNAIVENFGMYVESLRAWTLTLIHSSAETAPLRLLHMEFESGNAEDGPAVLLCPERIVSLHERVRCQPQSLCPPTLDIVTSRTLLKLTLLHELGHHYFRAHRVKGACYAPEALANGFVWDLIEPMERVVLQAKTQSQSDRYRAYEGLIHLSRPGIFGMPWAAILPWDEFVGAGMVASFQKESFAGLAWDASSVELAWPSIRYWWDKIEDVLRESSAPGFLGPY